MQQNFITIRPSIPQGVAIVLVGLFLVAAPLRALPTAHPVTGGFVNIEVWLGGVTIGSASGVALTGGAVTIDNGALTLDAVRLEIAPTIISLAQSFWGYDQIAVESAILEGDLSFATSASIGVPDLFAAVAGPLTVSGSWGATDSNGINSPTSGNPIEFEILSLIAVVNANPRVEINSVTINSIDGDPFGHPGEHLTIVGTYVVVTPEPGTGVMLILGLAGLGMRRRVH